MALPMNRQEFETANVRYGRDVAQWPAPERAAGEAFATSSEGQQWLQDDDTLENMLNAAARAGVADKEAESAFLGRLLDIPAQNTATQAAIGSHTGRGLWGWFGDLQVMMSPSGLAYQGAAFALALAVGVLVGMDSAELPYEDIDVNATLFADSGDLFEEDTIP